MVLKRRDWIDWRMHVGFVNGDQLGRGKIRDCGRLGCAMGKGERVSFLHRPRIASPWFWGR